MATPRYFTHLIQAHLVALPLLGDLCDNFTVLGTCTCLCQEKICNNARSAPAFFICLYNSNNFGLLQPHFEEHLEQLGQHLSPGGNDTSTYLVPKMYIDELY